MVTSRFEERNRVIYKVGDVVTFAEAHSDRWEEWFPTWRAMEVTSIRQVEQYSVLSIRGSVLDGAHGIAAGHVVHAEGPW